jgi:hypothetical protein
LIRAWRLFTLLFVGLSMGMAFCHLLQMPPRMQYDVWLWKYTKNMFKLFGPSLGIIIEAAATLLCAGLLILLPRRQGAFRWTLLCTICMLIAHSAWWLLIYPVNQETIGWTKLSIPGDWFLYRAQWELTHATRAIFEIVAFISLIISVLGETPKDGLSGKSKFISEPTGNYNQLKISVFLFPILNPLIKFLSRSTFQSFAAARARLD